MKLNGKPGCADGDCQRLIRRGGHVYQQKNHHYQRWQRHSGAKEHEQCDDHDQQRQRIRERLQLAGVPILWDVRLAGDVINAAR